MVTNCPFSIKIPPTLLTLPQPFSNFLLLSQPFLSLAVVTCFKQQQQLNRGISMAIVFFVI